MAQKVKIKKSKNLRYQLISLLYLVFIAISAIQIPDEWIRVNKQMTKYFAVANKEQIHDPSLNGIENYLGDVEQEFTLYAGINASTGDFHEPKSYSPTDNFFIKKGQGHVLHKKLWQLDSHIVHSADSRMKIQYEKLFATDIENGLRKRGGNEWVNWKFHHVPAIICQALLEEMKLRLHLLDKPKSPVADEAHASGLLKLAYNVNDVSTGDSLYFVTSGRNETTAYAIYEDRDSSLLTISPTDSIVFVPKRSGTYRISIRTTNHREDLEINVLPGNLKKNPTTRGIIGFYQGKPTKVYFSDGLKADQISCSCDQNARVSLKDYSVNFTPRETGWCSIKLVANNNTVVDDSIFIFETPEPVLKLTGASSAGVLAYERLKNNPSILLEAFHPHADLPYYDIEKVEYTLIGNSVSKSVAQGTEIALTDPDLKDLKFIIIDKVEVTSPFRNFTLSSPHVIRILKS